MVQLLKLMPAISLIDLYISDQIQSLFNDVKKNFLDQLKYVRDFDSSGRPRSGIPKRPKGSRNVGSARSSQGAN